ncbi:hypothetical protein MK163_16175, partial [bacterium]|nr:hypothetical protein [bacterium]
SDLGIEDANPQHIYWVVGAFGVLAVCLLVGRLVELLLAARRKQKASWNTFRQLTTTRGLKPVQIEVLMLVARQGSVKRPPKVLGSIQLFDKTVQKAQENYEFSEKQLILIDSIRKKLVASKVKWTPQTSLQSGVSWGEQTVLGTRGLFLSLKRSSRGKCSRPPAMTTSDCRPPSLSWSDPIPTKN